MELPPELKCESTAFQLGLPGEEELLAVVNQVLVEANREVRTSVSLDANDISQLARNLLGLTQDEAARTLRKCLLAHGKADAVCFRPHSTPRTPFYARMDCLKLCGAIHRLPMSPA